MAEAQDVSSKNKSSWLGFLKVSQCEAPDTAKVLTCPQSIASFNGDLSSMTAPAFILSTTSLTEFSAYWAELPKVFVAPASEPDPQKRALLVLKWFLSTLKSQYSSRSDKLGSEKKPLNPFLGEQFLGYWQDEAGRTELVSEQVRYVAHDPHDGTPRLITFSHHPPVTAYSIDNATHGVHLQGYNAQKAAFGRTINIKQVGHAILHIDKYNEDYLITLPALHIDGLITGSPYVELDNSTYIVSSSGYTSRIDYSGKGWVTGTKNSFSAVMFPTGKEKEKKEALYHVDGQWNDHFTIKNAAKEVVDKYSAAQMTRTPLVVAPIEQQGPLESRRAWKKVADAITAKDMSVTTTEKSLIENKQREMRKQEKEQGSEWQRRFFARKQQSAVLDTLIAHVPHQTAEQDQTDGIWEFTPASATPAA